MLGHSDITGKDKSFEDHKTSASLPLLGVSRKYLAIVINFVPYF